MRENTVEKHIGVLDGIRAFSVTLIVWYHFWQQSWLTPYINFDNRFTRYLGITSIELAQYVRCGFLFVDMLVLLSAFCNFYPYARAIVLKEPWPDTKEFYRKRALRILPSYYLNVFVVFFVFLLPEHSYESTALLWKDLLTRLTFTTGFFPDMVLSSKLNAVLWTVQVEIWYYLLLPWLARLFKRLPAATYLGMLLLHILSVNIILYRLEGQERIYVNHMLCFMGVYANGMLFCVLYVLWKKYGRENRYTRLAFTVLSVCCVVWFRNILSRYGGEASLEAVQLKTRLLQSFLFSGFIFFTAFAYRGWQKLFSNKLARFVCSISYNLYIWHQFIAVRLKQYKMPYWSGDTPPNMTGDKVWQWKYQILIIIVSVGVAYLLTYGFEIPVKEFFEKRRKGRMEKESC